VKNLEWAVLTHPSWRNPMGGPRIRKTFSYRADFLSEKKPGTRGERPWSFHWTDLPGFTRRAFGPYYRKIPHGERLFELDVLEYFPFRY